MSSREFVEILKDQDVRHDNVKRTMERLQDRGLIAFTPMEEMVPIGSGAKRQVITYHVNKRNSYVVMAQLSPEFTAHLVDRWRELEEELEKLKAQPSEPQIPQTYAEALMLAATQAKQIEEGAPKVNYFDNVTAQLENLIKLSDY